MQKNSRNKVRKYLRFLLRVIAVYVLGFALWLFVSPYYAATLGKVSLWMIPAFTAPDAAVSGVEYHDGEKLFYHIELTDRQAGKIFKKVIFFTTKELTVGLLTVGVLLWITPGLQWRKTILLSLAALAMLFIVYGFCCLFLLRITAFQSNIDFMTLGFVEKLFGLPTLVRWAEEGGFSLIITQLIPVMIWFVVVLPSLLPMISKRFFTNSEKKL